MLNPPVSGLAGPLNAERRVIEAETTMASAREVNEKGQALAARVCKFNPFNADRRGRAGMA